jgi:Lar family restriction alleviation protein
MKINDCPFCGVTEEDGLFCTESIIEETHCVVCNSCNTLGPTESTKSEAIKVWNGA